MSIVGTRPPLISETNLYEPHHKVTANQKTILNAFGLDANRIKYYAFELSKELKKAE